jgi:hypothetical protein
LIGALVALTALTGCEVSVVPFCEEYPDDPSCQVWNPAGDEISIGTSGPWTINGEVANASNCGAAGIAYVEVRLYQTPTDNAFYTTPAFRVPCDAASFDTRPDLVLRRDRYYSQWFALNSAGTEIGAMSDRLLFDTTALAVGSHAQLAPPDYIVSLAPTLITNLLFALPDGSGTGDCTTAGVSTISYTLNDGSGGVYDSMTDIACGTQITWDDIPPDTYSIYVEGATASGSKDWMATCVGLTVATTGMSAYDCTIEYVGTPTLRVAFGWDVDPGPTMTDGTCATAGVTVMSYQLSQMGVAGNVAEAYDVACADSLDFSDLTPGTYNLYVEGGTVAVKSWMSMDCNMYIVESGIESYTCALTRTM